MTQRIWAITQKELIQLVRDRVLLVLLLVMPLIQVTLFATAIHTDIKHIPMVVADQSMSNASRSYLNAFTSSDSFDFVAAVHGQADVMKAIDSGQASLGVVIPPDFATQTKRGQANVLLLVDGSDSFTTNSAYGTATAISQSYAVSLIRQPVSPLNMSVRVLYNPDMKDVWFLIPGMIAALVQGLTLGLTALAVVREREVGTIEALLVTPIRPVELMIGKTLPNLIIAFADTGSILAAGVLIFGVPFMGNLLLFAALSILFAFSTLALGLAISTGAQSQMQAQYLSAMFNFVGIFLAGFLFPAYALPPVLRAISYIIPMTYFLPITRSIFTKGVGIEAIWGLVLAMCVLLVFIVFLSARLFRQKLD